MELRRTVGFMSEMLRNCRKRHILSSSNVVFPRCVCVCVGGVSELYPGRITLRLLCKHTSAVLTRISVFK